MRVAIRPQPDSATAKMISNSTALAKPCSIDLMGVDLQAGNFAINHREAIQDGPLKLHTFQIAADQNSIRKISGPQVCIAKVRTCELYSLERRSTSAALEEINSALRIATL